MAKIQKFKILWSNFDRPPPPPALQTTAQMATGAKIQNFKILHQILPQPPNLSSWLLGQKFKNSKLYPQILTHTSLTTWPHEQNLKRNQFKLINATGAVRGFLCVKN